MEISEERLDYIKRLIEGIRENAEYVEIDGENCLRGRWIDSILLCAVVEEHLLKDK